MSSSDPDYSDNASSPESSSLDEYPRPTSRARPVSSTPVSPRKRRRSSSPNPLRSRKRHLDGQYNNAFRILFNETASAATTRFAAHEPTHLYASQIGAVQWSAYEKDVFFAALDKLGQDDVAGVAKAVGSKSVPETRMFLLSIQDAITERKVAGRDRNVEVTLQDIPAAPEIGQECEERLELASDALAWYQERFEAKQEQVRHGQYWLITPAVADEIEDAIGRPHTLSTSPPPDPRDNDANPLVRGDPSEAQILQAIPEAKILVPQQLLQLSKNVFMNPSPTIPYPWPNWSDLTSELATTPSMYRTAFNDFYALVVSLTKRLVQTALIQATSRVRSQGWREKKGVLRYVRKRDALAAIDILGMRRNSREQWMGVARRCALRVWLRHDGREVPWDEVERIMGAVQTPIEPLSTAAETSGLASGIEDVRFASRAARSGTPLPLASVLAQSAEDGLSSDYVEDDEDDEDEESDSYRRLDDQASQTSNSAPYKAEDDPHTASENESDALDDFDQAASRQEERQLWKLLGPSSGSGEAASDMKEEMEEEKFSFPPAKRFAGLDDWRSWIRYRAEWEECRAPIPPTSFLATRKQTDTLDSLRSADRQQSSSEGRPGRSSGTDVGQKREQKPRKTDLPIRGTRAYAAMQERISVSEDRDTVENAVEDDDAQLPTRSIEESADEDNWGSAVDEVMHRHQGGVIEGATGL